MEAKQIKIVKTPNVSETLKAIGVGERVVATKLSLSISAVRSAASRLKDDGLEFKVEDVPFSSRYFVTRMQ